MTLTGERCTRLLPQCIRIYGLRCVVDSMVWSGLCLVSRQNFYESVLFMAQANYFIHFVSGWLFRQGIVTVLKIQISDSANSHKSQTNYLGTNVVRMNHSNLCELNRFFLIHRRVSWSVNLNLWNSDRALCFPKKNQIRIDVQRTQIWFVSINDLRFLIPKSSRLHRKCLRSNVDEWNQSISRLDSTPFVFTPSTRRSPENSEAN